MEVLTRRADPALAVTNLLMPIIWGIIRILASIPSCTRHPHFANHRNP
jgi:hypothetical protein